MVYGMVRQSGGDVTVASGPEKGARIVILRPIALEPSQEIGEHSSESE